MNFFEIAKLKRPAMEHDHSVIGEQNIRLMPCIDIYQALTEKRPYKDGMSHKQSIIHRENNRE